MRNVSMMYLRPGNLYKEFVISSGTETVGSFGRPKASYEETMRTLEGCLAKADPTEVERWKQMQHPITHTIEQAGAPKAKVGDKLIMGERVFLIQGLDDCGGLGLATLYFAEERLDTK